MILTDSTAAEVGTSNVSSIASATAAFRYFHIYPGVVSYNQPISGTTGLVKTGNGTLQTGQIFNYTGPTQINAGQLEISSASVLNGVISGAGSLIKSGANTLTIGGSNTYSGGTSLIGIVIISSSNAFGTGTVTGTGGWDIRGAGAITLPNNFTSNFQMVFRISGGNTTITGTISGAGNLLKLGNGFLSLNASNLTYTGSTSTTAGQLIVSQTTGLSTATAKFTSPSLSVVFNVSPPVATTTNFRFFQGTTVQSYAPGVISLTGVPAGTTATYTSATSTLAVTVP